MRGSATTPIVCGPPTFAGVIPWAIVAWRKPGGKMTLPMASCPAPRPAMRELLAELSRSLQQGRNCVHCSVVETRGSTPQKAGAAMLVFPDGGQSGTLGGGCVEAEVKQRALRLLGEGGGEPGVLTFCLDDNYGWDDGLICGGRMSILADPLAPERRRGAIDYYRTFRDLVEAGQ